MPDGWKLIEVGANLHQVIYGPKLPDDYQITI